MALVERCSTEELPAEAFPPASRPEHVGIQAMEVYIPSTYVSALCFLAWPAPSHGAQDGHTITTESRLVSKLLANVQL